MYIMFNVMLCVHLLSADHIHIPTCIHSDCTFSYTFGNIHTCGLCLVYFYTCIHSLKYIHVHSVVNFYVVVKFCSFFS